MVEQYIGEKNVNGLKVLYTTKQLFKTGEEL